MPWGETGLVKQVGLAAHEDGGLLSAPAVVQAVLRLCRQPVGSGCAWCHIAVSTFGPFEYDIGPLLLHEGEETTVHLATLLLQHVAHHLDAGSFELAEAIARQRFEASLNMQFANEQAILNSYEELSILFGLHGKSLTIGKTEGDYIDNGYPQHLRCIASYGKSSEDDGFDEDYYIRSLSETTIPGKDLGNWLVDQINMMSEHKMTEKDQQDMISSIDEDAKVSLIESYDFFFNGWPCDMHYEKVTDLKNVRNMELYRIQWASRSWGVYSGSEDQQNGVNM